MAIHKQAFERTNKFEGFYSNDPADSGGETLYGISRKRGAPFPEFWTLVDQYKKKPNFPNNMKSEPKFMHMIEHWYKKNYWDTLRLDEIRNQHLANQLYDISVNKGAGTAKRFAGKLARISTNTVTDAVLKRLNDEATSDTNYFT